MFLNASASNGRVGSLDFACSSCGSKSLISCVDAFTVARFMAIWPELTIGSANDATTLNSDAQQKAVSPRSHLIPVLEFILLFFPLPDLI